MTEAEPADPTAVRRAGAADAATAADLLHRFNTEFDEPTPPVDVLARRLVALVASGETVVLLVGPPGSLHGLAVLRFRPALWSDGFECYLAELYVVPDRRGRGLGRALMEATIAEARARRADYLHVETSDADVVACHLYERVGMTDREHGPDGPRLRVYERDL